MSIHCYHHQANAFSDTSLYDSPCGNLNSTNPTVQCCTNGDSCLTNGFCSYQKSLVGGSGYYVGSCTTSICPDFSDRCTSQGLPDVKWNGTSGLWQCCGVDLSGNPSCDNPTNELFIAPARSLLQTIFSVPSDGLTATSTSIGPTASTTSMSVMTSSSSTRSVYEATSKLAAPASGVSSSTTASAPSSTSEPSSPQSGLSVGAKAGIGVGAALGALAVIGLLIYLVYRQRGRRRRSKEVYQPADIPRQR